MHPTREILGGVRRRLGAVAPAVSQPVPARENSLIIFLITT
jgi:hypothetical protein